MGLGGEVGADPEKFAVVSSEGPVIALLVDLVQGVVGILVAFELQDIDELVGLDEGVDAAVGGVAFDLHLLPHQLEHHIHRVLEVEFVVAHELVVHVGEEGREAAHQHIDVAGLDVPYEFVDGQLATVPVDWRVELAQGLHETVFHFPVGVVEVVKAKACVKAFDGQIPALVQQGDDIRTAGIGAGEQGCGHLGHGEVLKACSVLAQMLDEEGRRAGLEPVLLKLFGLECV